MSCYWFSLLLVSTLNTIHGSTIARETVPEAKILEAPRDVTTVGGGRVRITCRVSGVPKPEVKWSKDGIELTTGNRYIFHDSGDLEISRVNFSNTGTYTCSASNKLGQSQASANLIVKRPTRIVDGPNDLEITTGKSATFSCRVNSDLSLTVSVTWMRDDKPIDFEKESRFHQLADSSMRIVDASTLDSGIYTCVAHTEIDKVEAQAVLIVQDVPNPPNIVSITCTERQLFIEWRPLGDNRAPILGYSIERQSGFSPDEWETVVDNIPVTEFSRTVPMPAWGNYTFRIKARNKIGSSLPSRPSEPCINQYFDRPSRNPHNVNARGTTPNNIVISWDVLPQVEHNAPGLYYVVYFIQDSPNASVWSETSVGDWSIHKVVAEDQPTFQRYRIKVIAVNQRGESQATPMVYLGYSGEDVPLEVPRNFRLLPPAGSSEAEFAWDPVPQESVRGHFHGYKIETWSDEVEEKQETLITRNASQAIVKGLRPNSKNYARIRVINQSYNGPPSEALVFNTTEGVPGPVAMFEVIENGCSELKLNWKKPTNPNGILTGYNIYYQIVDGTEVGPLMERVPQIRHPDLSTATLPALTPGSTYRITIAAMTRAGTGEKYLLEHKLSCVNDDYYEDSSE